MKSIFKFLRSLFSDSTDLEEFVEAKHLERYALLNHINEELCRLKEAKVEIIDAIEEMGVEVPQGVLLNELPKYIRMIGKENRREEDGN